MLLLVVTVQPQGMGAAVHIIFSGLTNNIHADLCAYLALIHLIPNIAR